MSDKVLELTYGTIPYIQMITDISSSKQTPTIASLTAELNYLRTHHVRTSASLDDKPDELQFLI